MSDAAPPSNRRESPWRRPERWAQAGITIQFLALVRILAEYFRLKHVQGGRLPLAVVDDYVAGALIAAALCWLAVVLYFLRRHRGALAASVLSVAVLLAYKLLFMG
ncbi:MAG TPA: hypothetical protein VF746_01425 [Longimicrobium sp.]|jgi:hypothetical protein